MRSKPAEEKRVKKLREQSGMALVFVLLLLAITAVSASIILYGYQKHLINVRLLFDEAQVDTAKRTAREEYILDAETGGVLYYFEGTSRKVIRADTIVGPVPVTGYGRTHKKDNRRGQTGAAGIPNRQEDGGPQFLAVYVSPDGKTYARWQGKRLTGYDYTLMQSGERKLLTEDMKNQIALDMDGLAPFTEASTESYQQSGAD